MNSTEDRVAFHNLQCSPNVPQRKKPNESKCVDTMTACAQMYKMTGEENINDLRLFMHMSVRDGNNSSLMV